MPTEPTRRQTRLPYLAAAASLAVTVMTILPTQPAHAWGERQAVRGCGTNWITSYPVPGGGKAVTQELRGNCTGNLYAGVRNRDGQARWGAPDPRYATATFPGNFVGGTHRGCKECSASLT